MQLKDMLIESNGTRQRGRLRKTWWNDVPVKENMKSLARPERMHTLGIS